MQYGVFHRDLMGNTRKRVLAEAVDTLLTHTIGSLRSNRDALSARECVSPARFPDWVWWSVSSEASRSECG